mmetsp:Transcript_4733/g.13655  ORF Transcript_4733/g.13655 Transcript_4733/m.13655 type:complete len:428 (+) Transcript_4733:603-1886(+)
MTSFLSYGRLLVLLWAASTSSSDAFTPVTCTGSSPTHTALHVSSSFSSDDLSPEPGGGESQNKHQKPINEDAHLVNSRNIEFADLGTAEQSSERKRRMRKEEENRQRFVQYGDDLWNMREFMDQLSRKLLKSINAGDRSREEEIRAELRKIEHQDPDLVYEVELEKLEVAKREGRGEDARMHSIIAAAARSTLPQYNLEGLWVGKYGQHGYEMINVTYQGDLLVAYKVTGDKNVPRGEITFQADLDPLSGRDGSSNKGKGGINAPADSLGNDSPSSTNSEDHNHRLQPISLTDKAAKKWGTSQLPRHRGLGQVAEAGFQKNQWMEGQLIIIGEEYFSFAWVPIEQQIFFGRPSPELALKMLRESGAASITPTRSWEKPPDVDSDVKVLKEYINSCLEKTAESEDDLLSGNPFSCIFVDGDTEECYFQ